LSSTRLHLPLDHHLRCNAGMVGADHPQRILAAQPFVADHHVLQRVVERVADVQRSGHVRRRVHDGEGRGIGAFGAEQAVRFPVGIPLGFDGSGLERLASASGSGLLASVMA